MLAIALFILVIPGFVSAPRADIPAVQNPDAPAPIGTTLQDIRVDLDKLSKHVIAETNVTAVTNLYAAISALSGELRRAFESRIGLETELAKFRGMAAVRELPAVEQTTFNTTGEALDNLKQRIEEIKRNLAARRAQLAAMEKVLNDQINGEVKE